LRIIGILVLILELISLVIALRNECRKNNINPKAAKAKLQSVRSKLKSKQQEYKLAKKTQPRKGVVK